MKKLFLVLVFVLRTGTYMNANTSDIKTVKQIINCDELATAVQYVAIANGVS